MIVAPESRKWHLLVLSIAKRVANIRIALCCVRPTLHSLLDVSRCVTGNFVPLIHGFVFVNLFDHFPAQASPQLKYN